MTITNPTSQSNNSKSVLTRHLLIGAVINLAIMALFISGVNNPKPEWGEFWYVRPLVVVTIAGAFSGLFYNRLSALRAEGGWKLIVGMLLSLIVFVFVLWISSVLGLAGTLWN